MKGNVESLLNLFRFASGFGTCMHENLEMKSKVAKVELENTDLKKRMGQLEVIVKDLKKTLEQLAA